MARGSRNASIPYLPYSRPTPEYLNPPQGACGSSVMPLITTRPARNSEATRRARGRSVPRTAAWRPYPEALGVRSASGGGRARHLLDGPLPPIQPALGNQKPRPGGARLTAVQKRHDESRRDGL